MSVELRPYDNVKAQAGAVLVTRDMRPVTFIEFNPKLKEMVRVRVQIKGMVAPMTYFESGRRVLEKETKYDLFMLVEVEDVPAPKAKKAPTKTPVKKRNSKAMNATERTIVEYQGVIEDHERDLQHCDTKDKPKYQALLDSARAVVAALQAYNSLSNVS
jgi:hypothetical protein